MYHSVAERVAELRAKAERLTERARATRVVADANRKLGEASEGYAKTLFIAMADKLDTEADRTITMANGFLKSATRFEDDAYAAKRASA